MVPSPPLPSPSLPPKSLLSVDYISQQGLCYLALMKLLSCCKLQISRSICGFKKDTGYFDWMRDINRSKNTPFKLIYTKMGVL